MDTSRRARISRMSQNPEAKLKRTSTYKFASVFHNLRDSFPDRYMLPYFADASHKIEHCLYGTYRVAILHHRFLGGSPRELFERIVLKRAADAPVGGSSRRVVQR
jgi:hypothetical protein